MKASGTALCISVFGHCWCCIPASLSKSPACSDFTVDKRLNKIGQANEQEHR